MKTNDKNRNIRDGGMMFAACGNGVPDYDATGTFEATEVTVSAEASGKLLRLEVEEGTKLKSG